MVPGFVADIELARRLERAESSANAAFIEARAMLEPDVGATWIDVAGVYALFDGVASPLTQTFGIGVFDSFLEPEFEKVEQFFRIRGAPTFHEVCSFAALDTLHLLHSRGYRPVEESTVLLRTTVESTYPDSNRIVVRRIDESESSLWANIAAQGWNRESVELARFVEKLGFVMSKASGVYCFLAELEDQPIAAAALNVQADVALLAGASTIPAARRQGAQRALLRARLSFAASRGVGVAMVVTQPGSASERNAERQGFRPVYSRTKWGLVDGGA
jgi:GNAT superfamily N-acetyltransferase